MPRREWGAEDQSKKKEMRDRTRRKTLQEAKDRATDAERRTVGPWEERGQLCPGSRSSGNRSGRCPPAERSPGSGEHGGEG